MNLLVTVVAFLLAIGILVTIHELGHYWAARWCDVKILRFSLGFGRPLILRRRGPDQTEWVIAALPLGGYVKMADERDESVATDERARAFNNKSVWQRIFIVAAGPAANFLLAALFYWVLLVTGIPGMKAYLATPPAQTPAAAAGFVERELIRRVGDTEVRTWSDARLALIDQSVRRGVVDVEVEDETGHRYARRLDLDSLSKEDLDKDFLGKMGLTPLRASALTVLDEVVAGNAAARAGLQSGDRIVSIDGVPVTRWEKIVEAIASHPGQELVLGIERGAAILAIAVTPDPVANPADGKPFGRIGVKPQVDRTMVDKLGTVVRYGPLAAILPAFEKVRDMSLFSLKMMGRMLAGDVSWKNLSGPVTIADYAGQSAMLGWLPYLNFLALISISLGVLNLLPVPVLDGGQLMYYMAEILKGSPVSERVMQIGQQVGLALLLGLTAFAFYNDIHRLLTG
jgi:regulator of sigma E protease